MIKILETNSVGTPGEKTIGTYIASRMKNIVQAPSKTIDALYIYKPRSINKMPIIYNVIKKPN